MAALAQTSPVALLHTSICGAQTLRKLQQVFPACQTGLTRYGSVMPINVPAHSHQTCFMTTVAHLSYPMHLRQTVTAKTTFSSSTSKATSTLFSSKCIIGSDSGCTAFPTQAILTPAGTENWKVWTLRWAPTIIMQRSYVVIKPIIKWNLKEM